MAARKSRGSKSRPASSKPIGRASRREKSSASTAAPWGQARSFNQSWRRAQGPRLQPRFGCLRFPAQRGLAVPARSHRAAFAGGRTGRALAARHRHLETDGGSARLAAQGAWLERSHQSGRSAERLGRARTRRMGAVQTRAHPSRVLELGALVDIGGRLRRGEKDARPHDGGRDVQGNS